MYLQLSPYLTQFSLHTIILPALCTFTSLHNPHNSLYILLHPLLSVPSLRNYGTTINLLTFHTTIKFSIQFIFMHKQFNNQKAIQNQSVKIRLITLTRNIIANKIKFSDIQYSVLFYVTGVIHKDTLPSPIQMILLEKYYYMGARDFRVLLRQTQDVV